MKSRKPFSSMKSLIAFIAIALLSDSMFAQDSQDTVKSKNLGNEDIIILKSYQPVLNDAFKINITPSGDTSDVKAPELNYSIDPKALNSNYNLSPIKPVKIKDDNIKKLYHGFVKAGYGLENMPMLDMYFNALRSKDFDAGIYYKHLSTSGKIDDYGYPGSSNNEFGVQGTKYYSKFLLNAAVNYDRDAVHYYGFKTPPDLFTKEETKHILNDFNGNVKIASMSTDKDDFTYKGGMNFYSFKDNKNSSENNFGFTFSGGQNIKQGYVSGDASLEFMGIEQDSVNYNRHLIRLRPRFTISKELYEIEAGLNFAFEGNDGISQDHMYPHIKGSYQVIKDEFTVFASLTGDLRRNDLRGTMKENPYTSGNLELKNTNEKLTMSGGIRVKLAHDLLFMGEASFSRLTDQQFYFNEFDSLFPVSYTTIYDDVNLFSIKGSLEYKMVEKVTMAFNIDYNKFNTDELEHPLYSPAFRFGASGEYVLADKISVKADLFYNSKAYAIEYPANDAVPAYTTLKSYFDANIGLDYRYSKVLSGFIQLNNIGFSRYYEWYRYPSYRLTAMLGATYSF